MKKQLRLLLPVMLLVGAQVKGMSPEDYEAMGLAPNSGKPYGLRYEEIKGAGLDKPYDLHRYEEIKGAGAGSEALSGKPFAATQMYDVNAAVPAGSQGTGDGGAPVGTSLFSRWTGYGKPSFKAPAKPVKLSEDNSKVASMMQQIPAGSVSKLSRSELRARQLEDLNEGWAAVEPTGLSDEEYANLANEVAKKQLSLQNPSMFTRAFDAIGMGYDKMKGAMTAIVDAVSSGFTTANAYLSPKFQAMGQTLLSSTDATFAWINQDRTHQAGSIAALVAVASGLGYVYRENLKAALRKVKASILGKEKLVKEDIALLAELEKHASKLEEPKSVVREQVVKTSEPQVAAEVSAPVVKRGRRR